MKAIILTIVGVVLVMIWWPLALMYFIVVISLHLFQEYHKRRLAEAERPR